MAEEPASGLRLNKFEALKAAEKVGSHCLGPSRAWAGLCPGLCPGLADPLFSQKARWGLVVLILALVGFIAMIIQLLWGYDNFHLFGGNQSPAPNLDCE